MAWYVEVLNFVDRSKTSPTVSPGSGRCVLLMMDINADLHLSPSLTTSMYMSLKDQNTAADNHQIKQDSVRIASALRL